MQSIDEKFEIRLVNIDDIPEIIKIDQQLGNLHLGLGEKIKTMLSESNSIFLVALFENRVVGYAGAIIRDTEFGEDDPVGYITHVGLTAEFKSKGMGRMLGDKLIDLILEKTPIIRTIISFDRIDLQSFFNHIGLERTDLLVYQYRE